jgi:putative ABC transport system permease protein
MKNYQELTGRYLLQQKKRSLLAILGIIISVALICAAGLMGESLQNSMHENVRRHTGNYHVFFTNIEADQVNLLRNNVKAEAVGTFLAAGFYRAVKGQSILIGTADSALMRMFYKKPVKGRLPQRPGEIAMEQWLVDNMPGKPAIGDRITLEIHVLTNHGAATEAAASRRRVTREFILAGIFKNEAASQQSGGSQAVVTMQTALEILNYQDLKYLTAVRFKEKIPLQPAIKETARAIGVTAKQVVQNTPLLVLSGQTRSNSSNRSVMILEIIMITVILLTAVAVIYNVFHISVIERIHQFGILRAVGSTPGQIRTIVLGEALILASIGVTLGVGCGILVVKAVFGLFMLISGEVLFGSLKMVIDGKVIGISAATGFLAVLLSAWGPAVMAGRVSAMEAILNTSKFNKDKIVRKKHPLMRKLCGIAGVMAYENLKRNRKRFYITVISMSIGIALFVFFTSFLRFVSAEFQGDFAKDYVIDKPVTKVISGYTLADYQDLEKIRGIKTVYRFMMEKADVLLTPRQTTVAFQKYNKRQRAKYTYQDQGTTYHRLDMDFYGLRQAELQICKENVIQGKLDIPGMNAESGVLVYQKAKFNQDNVVVSDLKVGDTIRMIPNGRQEAIRLKVLGILNRLPMAVSKWNAGYQVVTTEEVYRKLTGVTTFVNFAVELAPGADQAMVKQQIEGIQKRIPEARLLDYSDLTETQLQIQMSIILYGLVFAISLVGALNIINTISTNLILRTREFGTLRAVGMTPGQMRQMIRLEGAFYGLTATLYGGISGVALAWLLYSYMNKIQSMPWSFPWGAWLIGSVAALLIGWLATSVPLKRLSALSVVEAVRAEE